MASRLSPRGGIACPKLSVSPPYCPPPASQGLDWFSKSMLRDSDGDCAHSFLEEASQQQQQRRQQQGGAACTRSQQQPRSGGGKQAKQQAALQCKSRGAQSAGPSDLLLDSGNVYVVPHDS